MAISLTLFKSQFDNKTHRTMDLDNWQQFSGLLCDLSNQPKGSKRDAELISPAHYKDGTTRANKNVLSWAGWCAVDVDDWKFEGELKNALARAIPNWGYICYSTASSTKDQPKFRLVFRLDEPIESERIRQFWHALNTELGEMGDKQTKDLSRMYYIPALYDGANNFYFDVGGDSIDVASLIAKHPYNDRQHSNNFLDRLPEELQKQVIEYRKSKLDNTSVSWSSYRNCPFWPRKLAAEYVIISNTGWYSKMYQMMVAISSSAIRREYPITSNEIAQLCREFDAEHGNWYENRPLTVEADRALEYVYRNS
tara:strand:- start:1903 stop:2832 length:930 start_codon:yes stop_codon:yes gene_type:complete